MIDIVISTVAFFAGMFAGYNSGLSDGFEKAYKRFWEILDWSEQ